MGPCRNLFWTGDYWALTYKLRVDICLYFDYTLFNQNFNQNWRMGTILN